jgi:glycosyltransferase involved in cell wall biosynthesis
MNLSVVIATSGDLQRLPFVLEGWAHQTDKNFDLHLVQGGGHPNLLNSLVAECTKKFSSFHHYYIGSESTNIKVSAARNVGIKHAKGDRVLTVDQDCLPALNLVEAHKAYGTRSLIIVGLRNEISQEHFINLPATDWAKLYKVPRGPGWREGLPEFQALFKKEVVTRPDWWCQGSHCSFPTKALRDIGGYWEAFTGWGWEDGEIALRLTRYGLKMYVDPELMVYHLWHPRLPERVDNRRLLQETVSNPAIIVRNNQKEI